MKAALILVDIQNDFIPGGALAVPDGDAIVPAANSCMGYFDEVIATQDWHPADHGSFASQHDGHAIGEIITFNGLKQILWPDHCIRNTPGADFVTGLDTDRITRIFRKGEDKNIDSYSGFFDNGHLKATGLGDYLKSQEINDITVVGLATDYCVKYTVLDARQLGFRTTVVLEGVRGVEIQPGDSEKALLEMKTAGAAIKRLSDVKMG